MLHVRRILYSIFDKIYTLIHPNGLKNVPPKIHKNIRFSCFGREMFKRQDKGGKTKKIFLGNPQAIGIEKI